MRLCMHRKSPLADKRRARRLIRNLVRLRPFDSQAIELLGGYIPAYHNVADDRYIHALTGASWQSGSISAASLCGGDRSVPVLCFSHITFGPISLSRFDPVLGTCSSAPKICSLKPRRPICHRRARYNPTFCDGHHIGPTPTCGTTATDVTSTSTRVARMMPLGTPELVLLLIALGGMTAAATWGVIELKRPRK